MIGSLANRSAAVSKVVNRMATGAGKRLYGLRKSTIETTLGFIQDSMGFRYPIMHGCRGIQTECQLACPAWNAKQVFKLSRQGLF